MDRCSICLIFVVLTAVLHEIAASEYKFHINRRFGSIEDTEDDEDEHKSRPVFKTMNRHSVDESLRNDENSTATTPFTTSATLPTFFPTAAAVLQRAPRVFELPNVLAKHDHKQHHARRISGPCRFGDVCLLHCFSDFKDIHGVSDIIDMAIEWINQRDDMFPNYRLAVQHMDTFFFTTRNIGESVFKLTKALNDGIPKALVIGPTFSREANVLAALAPMYNVMLMSYSAGAADLSDSSLYPYFARTVTSQNRLLPFIYQTWKYFQYTACFIIYERKKYNTQYANEIENVILARNNTDKVVGKESYDSKEDIDVIITKLLTRSIRVLIVSFEGMGYLPGYFFCEARKRGVSTRDYFFLIDAAVDSWHNTQGEEANIGCTQDELNVALEGVLQVGVARALPDSVNRLYQYDGLRLGISQTELSSLKKTYEATMGVNGSENGIEIGFWQQAYEAVIAGSLALNATIGEYYNHSISDPQIFQSEQFMKALFHAMTRVKMVGFTGPLIFEKNGDRVVTFVLEQIRMATLKTNEQVAFLIAGETNITWVEQTAFPTANGGAPAQWEPEHKHLTSYVLPYAITGVAIIVLILALAITYVFQRRLRRKLLKELYSMQWKINASDLVDNNTNCYAKPLTLTLSAVPTKTSSAYKPTQKLSTATQSKFQVTNSMSILSLAELESRQRAADDKEQAAKKISFSGSTAAARNAVPPHHPRSKRRSMCKQQAIDSANQTNADLTRTNRDSSVFSSIGIDCSASRLRKVSSGFHSSDSGGSPQETDISDFGNGATTVAPKSANVFPAGIKKQSSTGIPLSNFPYRITTYKSSLVHLVGLKRGISTNISREKLMEIKMEKDIIHQNCCKFVGIILEPHIRALCFEYPSKGPLQELLLTETFDLDWDFKVSLLKDVVEGLFFIHSSSACTPRLHGRLSAKYTCLVDDHFVCKLTNFGVPSFTRDELYDLDAFMWRSPEFLSNLVDSAAVGAYKMPPATLADSFEFINEIDANTTTNGLPANSPAAKAWRRLRSVTLNNVTNNTRMSSSPIGQRENTIAQKLMLVNNSSSDADQTRMKNFSNAAVMFQATNNNGQLMLPNNFTGKSVKTKSINVSTMQLPKSTSNNSMTPLSQLTPLPDEMSATPSMKPSFRFFNLLNDSNHIGGSRSCDICPSPPIILGGGEAEIRNSQQFFRSSSAEIDPRRSFASQAAWQRAAAAISTKAAAAAKRGVPVRRRRSASTTSASVSPTTSRHVNIGLKTNSSPLQGKRSKFSTTTTVTTTTCDSGFAPPNGGGPPAVHYSFDNNYSKLFTAADDVYALGLIITQVMNRCVPYNVKDQAGKLQILSRVQNGALADLTPMLTANDEAPSILVDTAYRCLNKTPEMRPRLPEIRELIHKIIRTQGYAMNMMENLLARMDTYAKNLEGLVRERTEAFFEEKKRSEALLHSILPRSVADQLKAGKNVDPESYDGVTIYFSDIVGFTSISAESTPLEVVTMLNELYTLFDNILHQYDAYKVETIGDAYMVVSGLPVRNGSEHARQIALFSLHLLYRIYSFKIPHRATNETLKLRIGLHSGSCCAGVVGFVCPRYCLFGDTVNTASRMESTGEELRIHCSDSCKRALDKFGHFKLSQRGKITVKVSQGKGEMTTYWLVGDTKPTNINQPSRMRTFECNI